MTDVTGFGLAGHALEMARGARCEVQLDWASVPLLPGVRALAAQGFVTGASGRNWAGYGADVVLARPASRPRTRRCSPTRRPAAACSCPAMPASLDAVLAVFGRHGFAGAAVVGRITAGSGRALLRVA